MVWWSKIVCAVYLGLILVGAPAWFFAHAGQPTVPYSALGPSLGRIIWIMSGVGGFALWVVLVFLLYSYKAEDYVEIDRSSMTYEEVVDWRFSSWFLKHGISAGHTPTPAEIQLLIDDIDEMATSSQVNLFSYDYPGCTPDYEIYAHDYAERWVKRAPLETLPMLLEVLDAGRSFQVGYFDDYHEDGLTIVLGKWGEKRLHPWLEEIGARFNNPMARPTAFASLDGISPEVVLPILTPWIERANELSEMEILIVISNLEYWASPLVIPVFRQFVTTLRDPSAKIMKALEAGIANNEKSVRRYVAANAEKTESSGAGNTDGAISSNST